MKLPARRVSRILSAALSAAVLGAIMVAAFDQAPPAAADPPAATPPAGSAGLRAAAAPAAFRGYGAITGDMNKVTDLGFNWIKLGVEWDDIQPNNGNEFNAPSGLDNEVANALARGLKILVNVSRAPAWATGGNTNNGAPPTDPATIQALMERLSARYAGRVSAWEYGNEPNTHDFWGKQNPDPVKFAQVMAGFFKGTKKGDPNAFVITGGLSNTGDGNGGGCVGACSTVKGDLQFVMELYTSPARQFSMSCTDPNGAARSCWDAIGHHPYGGPHAPEVDPYVPSNPPATGLYFMRLYQIYQMIREFGGRDVAAAIAIWVTEFGWITDRGKNCDFGSARNAQKVTASQQADYFVRAYQMMHAPRSISSGDTMPFPDVMGPLFIFHLDLKGENPSCPPAGQFDDAFYGTAPETKTALKAMPKTGITPVVTATASPTASQTPTATRTPTVTPTHSVTPQGTVAKKAFMPLITKNKTGGW